MARKWSIQFSPRSVDLPSSNYAQDDELPTTLAPCNAFDATTDETVILSGIVPAEAAGGTIKLGILACANTTTAADDARIDTSTEFRTPVVGESANADNFGSLSSGTMTFSTTAYSVQLLTITLTLTTTPAAGDKFRIKVTRDANHATLDDLASDLLVLGYDLYEE